MTISIIGTNGFLANEIGLFCTNNLIQVILYGRREPTIHIFQEFNKIDLITEKINVSKLLKSDVIIYASGAGVQSNRTELVESIYNINTYVPINICNELNNIGYEGIFVTFGSCFEIGNNIKSSKFTETDILTSMLFAPNDYCISKRLLSRFVASKKQNFKHLHLILPTVYGEKEAEHRLIPYTVSSIKRNVSMQFTSGKQIRQYIYVGDVVKIIFELISLNRYGIYNLSGEETYSVRALIEEIHKFYGYDTGEELFGKVERVDIGMRNLQLDDTLIKSLLPDFKYSRLNEILKLYDNSY